MQANRWMQLLTSRVKDAQLRHHYKILSDQHGICQLPFARHYCSSFPSLAPPPLYSFSIATVSWL